MTIAAAKNTATALRTVKPTGLPTGELGWIIEDNDPSREAERVSLVYLKSLAKLRLRREDRVYVRWALSVYHNHPHMPVDTERIEKLASRHLPRGCCLMLDRVKGEEHIKMVMVR